MLLNLDILNTMLAILLPIALGYLLKLGRLFKEGEIAALRKFVMRVALPFLIFQNLYRADVASLQQALPIVAAFMLITILYTLAAGLVAPWMGGDEKQRLTFAFAVFAGNYAFLGWGVIVSFFGEQALTRAVFFSMFFWPVFLTCGFFLRRRFESPQAGVARPAFLKILARHAGVPWQPASDALPTAGSTLLVEERLQPPAQQLDAQAWRDAMVTLDRERLAPLAAALRGGRVKKLILTGLGDETTLDLELTRGDALSFWRRPRSLLDVIAP